MKETSSWGLGRLASLSGSSSMMVETRRRQRQEKRHGRVGALRFQKEPQAAANHNLKSDGHHQRGSRHRRLPTYSYKFQNYDMSGFSSTAFLLETTEHKELRVDQVAYYVTNNKRLTFLPRRGTKRLAYPFDGVASVAGCQSPHQVPFPYSDAPVSVRSVISEDGTCLL